MTKCIVDTKHLLENCLQEFQNIECRGLTITMIRGMHSKVAQVADHWKVTMGYTIELSLAKEIIKSLNSKIQGKLFDTNFFRTLLNNRSECRKQALEEKQKISADNDITLWLAVLDYTISIFEDQLEFAAGSGKPTRPSTET